MGWSLSDAHTIQSDCKARQGAKSSQCLPHTQGLLEPGEADQRMGPAAQCGDAQQGAVEPCSRLALPSGHSTAHRALHAAAGLRACTERIQAAAPGGGEGCDCTGCVHGVAPRNQTLDT